MCSNSLILEGNYVLHLLQQKMQGPLVMILRFRVRKLLAVVHLYIIIHRPYQLQDTNNTKYIFVFSRPRRHPAANTWLVMSLGDGPLDIISEPHWAIVTFLAKVRLDRTGRRINLVSYDK
jgi:hypothetical protein